MAVDLLSPATRLGHVDCSSHSGGLDVPVSRVAGVYDGSNLTFHVLRLDSWGPALMNLGYYPWAGRMAFMNTGCNMEKCQRTLVVKAAALLDIQSEDRILDVACGRGKSSFMMSLLHPDTSVIGLDLLEENVQVASTLFKHVRGLSYRSGSAMDLPFEAEVFERIICIEAAFHFPDRARFLREAYRVLRPGGRLVVVDFAWKTDADRVHRDDPQTQLVRDAWQWDDLYSIDDYRRAATQAGFESRSQIDWTQHVTVAIQQQFRMLAWLARRSWGRKLVEWFNPLYGSVTVETWQQITKTVQAHGYVARFSKYMAFVFDKPIG